MYPILFSNQYVTIYSYGFMIMLGVILAYVSFYYLMNKKHWITHEQAILLFLSLIIASYIGGKAFYYLENFAFYYYHPKQMFQHPANGFVFYGSVCLAIPTLFLYIKKNQLPLGITLDAISLVPCIAQAFGRLGCFLAGCCYGKPTQVSWAVTYHNPRSLAPLNISLHPTPLYEFTWLCCIIVTLLVIKNKINKQGFLFLIYLFLYAVGRFFIEYFRNDNGRGFIDNDLVSSSQLISALLILISMVIIMRSKKPVFTD